MSEECIETRKGYFNVVNVESCTMKNVCIYVKHLEQENQQLKEDFKRLRITEILKENKLLKENKNFCEMINDKEWVDYKFEYENNQRVMKDLFKQLDLYKSVLDEIRERIEFFMEDGRGSLLELLEILDKVKE